MNTDLMKTIIDILKERELFEDMTSPDLEEKVQSQMTVYAGFDPSSDSLQVGNLVTLMTLARFQKAGHNVIAVAGGATGTIGDPSGKSAERNLLSAEQVADQPNTTEPDCAKHSHPCLPSRPQRRRSGDPRCRAGSPLWPRHAVGVSPTHGGARGAQVHHGESRTDRRLALRS